MTEPTNPVEWNAQYGQDAVSAYPPIPDSAWLAPMVVQAFTEGRYELGAALARLVVQAERVERHTNTGAAYRGTSTVAGPIFDGLRTGEIPGHQHVQEFVQEHAPEAAQVPADDPRELPFRETLPTEEAHPVTPTARCIALVGAHECHQVIYWVVAEGRWTHLDPVHNTHEPFADRTVTP